MMTTDLTQGIKVTKPWSRHMDFRKGSPPLGQLAQVISWLIQAFKSFCDFAHFSDKNCDIKPAEKWSNQQCRALKSSASLQNSSRQDEHSIAKKMNLSETLFAFLLTISCSLIRSSGFELRTSGYQLPQAPSELVQDQSWNKSNIFINVLCSGKQATVYTNLLYLECSDEHGCSTAHCLKTGSYFGIQIQSAFFVLFSFQFI